MQESSMSLSLQSFIPVRAVSSYWNGIWYGLVLPVVMHGARIRCHLPLLASACFANPQQTHLMQRVFHGLMQWTPATALRQVLWPVPQTSV